MSSQPTIFKRTQVRDPQGQTWLIVVEDRLDPSQSRLARDSAERYGRYAMTIYAPNGQHAEVLVDANILQVDRELSRFQSEITAGSWGSDLLASA